MLQIHSLTQKKIVKPPNLNNITNNVINLTSHGSYHFYSSQKATLIFPYLIAFHIHSTTDQNIYHYTHLYLAFFCSSFVFDTAANEREKNEMEYKKLLIFVGITFVCSAAARKKFGRNSILFSECVRVYRCRCRYRIISIGYRLVI